MNICKEFEGYVTLYDLPKNFVIGEGFTCVMHLHTLMEEVAVTQAAIMFTDEHDVQHKIKSAGLKSKEKGYLKFRTLNPICLEKYCDFPELGSFVLRRDTFTIG